MNEVYLNLLKASFSIIFLLLIDFIAEFLLTRNIQEKKKSAKLRVMLRYVLFFCFIFFMAKIWVEGFGYLLTFVGIVAAALTITQKEYLMNFFGWLIIMWRDLFVEGDFIEIGKYTGYVNEIRPLYFIIEEASSFVFGDKTGRMIKIPNSLIAVNPIIHLTVENALAEGLISYTFTMKSNLEKIQQCIPALEAEIEKHIRASLKPSAQFLLKIHQDKPSGIQLKIKYSSYLDEQLKIEEAVFNIIMQMVKNNPDVELTEVT